MKRREFVRALLGAAAIPAVARAQPAKVPTIGVLMLGIPDPAPFLKALREGFASLSYVEGRNIRLDIHDAAGQSDVLAEKAAELVRLKPDIIIVWQTPAAIAAKQATSDIPIVMTHVGDPVASGLVASLARPGGNMTGWPEEPPRSPARSSNWRARCCRPRAAWPPSSA
jgi:putative tryptophan/tyrosine transport system substrate-binding protein